MNYPAGIIQTTINLPPTGVAQNYKLAAPLAKKSTSVQGVKHFRSKNIGREDLTP